MAILSITAAAKAAGVSRTTIYEKVKDGDLSRTPEGIDTAELLRVFGSLKSGDTEKLEVQASQPKTDDMTLWLREKLDAAERELRETRDELQDTTERLQEHREAARLLIDPETFQQKEQAWKESLEARQAEIESARNDAAELAERLKSEVDERTRAETLAKALKGRGLIDRLLNRQPDIIV